MDVFKYKQLIKLLFVVIPLQLTGYIILPFVLLFYIKDDRYMSKKLMAQRLPKYLSWFDNGDIIDMRYGLNGDIPHQYRHKPKGKLGILWMRYKWLAIRNPINNFKWNVLGIPISEVTDLYVMNAYQSHIYLDPPHHYFRVKCSMYHNEEDMLRQEIGDWAHAGTREVSAKYKNKYVYEYYKVYQYPFKKDKCFRIRIGYKFGHNPWNNVRRKYQWVYSVIPWKSYKGV